MLYKQTNIFEDSTEGSADIAVTAGEPVSPSASFKSFEVHSLENNIESQINLEENRERFSGQCKKLFDYLMAGGECNGDIAKELFGIRHLPRRRKDLTDSPNNILISDKWENGMKTLFMTEEDKRHNQKLLNQRKAA